MMLNSLLETGKINLKISTEFIDLRQFLPVGQHDGIASIVANSLEETSI